MEKTDIRILIVEDEPLLLEAITTKLNKLGISCHGAISGRGAIEYLEKNPVPKAIWLDYYLKDMNGLEFMHEVKKNQAWANIPVIVVSNSANEENVHSMMTLGAKEYLLKAEHRLDDLIDTVEKYIQD